MLHHIQQVLAAYPERFHTETVEPIARRHSLGRCRYWILKTDEGPFCLRRWPENEPTRERLQFQQAVLWHCVCEGIDFVPLPFETLDCKGFVEFSGSFWEVLPWLDVNMPDAVEFFTPLDPRDESSAAPKPTGRQLEAAMAALARFHVATSFFPLPNPPVSVSPKISMLLKSWKKWISGRFETLSLALLRREQEPLSPEERCLVLVGRRLLGRPIQEMGNNMALCSRAARLAVPIQPIHGNPDVRHFRFDGDDVCGLLDFQTIGADSVALDVAILLDSLAQGDAVLWVRGIRAYQNIRPLEDNERFLISVFDRIRGSLEGLERLCSIYLDGETLSNSQIRETARRLQAVLRNDINDSRNAG